MNNPFPFAGLIYDDSIHYLDHLAPCCSLLKWPLIICEAAVADLARTYYPELEVVESPLWELKLPKTTLTCDTQPLLRAAFPGQETETIWLPHGNSDKGVHSPFFEALKEEKIALVYGQKMVDFMESKKVFLPSIRIGNFRLEYFKKHKPFYEKLFQIPSGNTFLYAPTWDDLEHNCSFWNSFPDLADQIPKNSHLLIKLHPNTLRKFEPEIEILKGRYRKKENLIFLPELPPIYPLLNQCSAYIGDMSSIGYDFLTFDRPLYFLNANKTFPLHKCGKGIEPKTFDFSIEDTFSPKRKELYRHTFDPAPDWDRVREEIDARCSV